MAKIQSVDREKFVVRFDKEGVRSQVEAASADQHISMNAFILQAVDEKLARGARIDRLLDVVERGAIINNTSVIRLTEKDQDQDQ